MRLFIEIFISLWCVGYLPVKGLLHTFWEHRRKVKEEEKAMLALTGTLRSKRPWFYDESFGSWT
jgi:hypothetical protein